MRILTTGDVIAGFELENGEALPQEYAAILASCPTPPDGYDYHPRADTLEWELVELPPAPDPDEEEVTADDYETALRRFGV